MISRENFDKKQIVYCFGNSKEKISIKNDNLIITDKDGKTKLQTSCYRLFAVFLIGNASITTYVINMAKKFGFSIVIMTNTFKVKDILGFKMEGNTLLNRKQYEYKENEIAKYIVENKIESQINVLKKIKDKQRNNTIKSLTNYLHELKKEDITINYIMGIEGISSKLYFKELFKDNQWIGRKPRIKIDYINSAMDIGYTILFNYIELILRIYGFDIYIGFLHREFYMRKSLVCDFVEPFRSIIDWQIRKSINLNQFKEKDFKKINSKYHLKWENNKKYVQIFSNCINDYKNEIFIYIQQFYRNFMKQRDISTYKKIII